MRMWTALLCFCVFLLEAGPVFGQALASPDEIHLSGNKREEDMASSLGRVKLRWPRSVEQLFGRNPLRAMADAMQTASRALKSASFPTKLQTLDMDWQVVFMDENLPEAQIPYYLVSNCHPAWMTPPSNIYVVAQRVAAGCGGESVRDGKVADAMLVQVLLHEVGHALEAQLIKKAFGADRMRAEGFASWFEQYASDYSGLIPKGKVSDHYSQLARQALQVSSSIADFNGSAYDYAKASLIFRAMAARRGVAGLIDVYEAINEKSLSFPQAIHSVFAWDERKLAMEMKRVLN